ncbi:synemin-like [Megalops cyprinoides]|uniref:synemin-like n=1 Tax=Megalops cyprinoides TaxID=118141 RepID=UPI00186505A7|nr:synemin-like [Megalops cyprinoides]
MFQFRRTFENEKLQLHELNKRLSQYLSRVKQLEQENAFLITEINTIRQDKTVGWENQYMTELRDLRRAVDQLAFEKSKAEMEREKLWKEFQMVQALCREQSGLCRNIDGELKGCEKQLHETQKTNCALEERLFQLENEYKGLEDVHRQEIAHLRNEVYSRAMPIVAQNYHAPPALSMEEIEEYAQHLSECWMETFEVYQRKVEELEDSIRADEAKLEDLQREKMQYASDLKKLHSEAEKQGKLQAQLEEQLMNMQGNCHMELDEYRVIIEELEEERRQLSATLAEKLRDYQNLTQVKMGLSLEVAAYRALLEGESKGVQVRTDRYPREALRRIENKMPVHSHAVKESAMTWQDGRRHYPTYTGFTARYMEPASSMRISSSSQLRAYDVTSTVPVTASGRALRSPAARRDMLAFTKASQATTSSVRPVTPNAEKKSAGIQKKIVEQTTVRSKEISQPSAKDSDRADQTGILHTSSAGQSPMSPNQKQDLEDFSKRSVRVVSPPMMRLATNAKEEDKAKVREVKIEKIEPKVETDMSKVTKRHGSEEEEAERDIYRAELEEKEFPSEGTVLETITMEEIIEKVVRPAGLDAKMSSSPDSKITYHVEKTEEEDGTTKTKIILESKVEEDVDMSDESALEELLSKGVKTVALEDIKGTPTGKMIESLLSLGFQTGESFENKSVNVEIIEEPVEDQSDEETEVKVTTRSSQPSSMFFQIEELENEPQSAKLSESSAEATKTSMAAGGYRKVETVGFQEGPREADTPYFTQLQETEYFVSTPDDNASEPEEESGFSSYGHYGVVDDLSDERYYQEASSFNQKFEESESSRAVHKTAQAKSDQAFTKDSFPECIIEEEVHVSPSVQESMLELLKEDTMDPKQQLRGALEQLQGTVSGALKEELALFTRGEEGSDNLAVDIKKVQQAPDNGKVTIVAELNVSQTLEDSGLLEEQGGDMSEEQIMSALRSGDPSLRKAISTRDESYTVKVSKDQDITVQGTPWMGISEGQGVYNVEESANEFSKTEKHIKLVPAEKSFTFQMDVGSDTAVSTSDSAQEARGFYLQAQGASGREVGEDM